MIDLFPTNEKSVDKEKIDLLLKCLVIALKPPENKEFIEVIPFYSEDRFCSLVIRETKDDDSCSVAYVPVLLSREPAFWIDGKPYYLNIKVK